jgi:hypothetical protein
MKWIIGMLLLAIPQLAFAEAGPVAAQGMIGDDLQAVRDNSDFFTFFHLQPTGPVSAPGTIEFRPSGPQFRLLVRVTATVDSQGKIAAMSLAVLRSFIDDPQNGAFAGDIVKSFLRGAPPLEDQAALLPLAEDIELNQRAGVVVLRAQPRLPAGAPAPEYAVYTGASSDPVDRHLARTDFRMQPSSEAGQPALALSLVLR